MTKEETICFLRQLQQILIYSNSWKDVKQVIRESFSMAIEALEAQRWTPVSKKLPEKEGRYWVWAEKSFVPDHVDESNRYQGSTEADFMGGRWYGRNVEEVIAWMPLPEPYKEDKDGAGSL